ncbi:MAG: GNAT family N-acetyltransferase [Lachnospiraceae bacterium]|nr:GNAT family N-acetyltransferase [Lachnospiraceae bacterium]MBP3296978.1 GNAT family N-acetyltransferase [Lachnospiraceae bacterium]
MILIALAEGHIIARAELEVMVDNQAAIALYRKMGFSEVGVYKIFGL